KGKAPKGGWPVITYAHGTTGIADSCAPSLDNGKNAAHAYSAYSYPLMNSWLKRGYAVVRTDYQGLGTPGTHEYLGGVSEGHSTLDIVLASRRLDKGLSRRFVIAGHSQGGHAALWAAAQAARWTPSLTLRGTVAFAPASHLSEQVGSVRAITTPSGITGLLAMIVRGLDTTTPSSGVRADLSGPAAALYPQTLTKCLVELSRSDSFGGIAPSDLFRSDADVDPVVKALDKSDPENLKITTPLLVAQGGKDTTVFPALTDQLVQQYRDGGTKVDYHQYPDADHVGAVLQGAGDATKWIDGRLR
ncbi:MAG: hypothetical protein QOJ07_3378, partial [Thermoleophilaceae bacterium]|nr:hypothetical protein [Thermoleophilaceae bacterium]